MPRPVIGLAGWEDDFVGGIGLPGNSWPFIERCCLAQEGAFGQFGGKLDSSTGCVKHWQVCSPPDFSQIVTFWVCGLRGSDGESINWAVVASPFEALP